MKVFILAGSSRQESLNRKLASSIDEMVSAGGHTSIVKHIGEFQLPLYNGDWESEHGVPQSARDLKLAMADADALIFVSPEYNGSIPGTLKNTIDWISRPDKPYDGGPFLKGKPVLMASASPGYFGGARMQFHLRDVLSQLGANVYGQSISVPSASKALDENGAFTDEKAKERAEKAVNSFLEFVS